MDTIQKQAPNHSPRHQKMTLSCENMVILPINSQRNEFTNWEHNIFFIFISHLVTSSQEEWAWDLF